MKSEESTTAEKEEEEYIPAHLIPIPIPACTTHSISWIEYKVNVTEVVKI